MINSKKNIKKLSGWEFQKQISKIPFDHNTILVSVSEYGNVDLKQLRYIYIYTLDEEKEKFIDILRKGLVHIKNDDLDSLYEMEIE